MSFARETREKREKQKMDNHKTRTFYVVRRKAEQDFHAGEGFTHEILDASRYTRRDDAETKALELARSDEGLRKPEAVQTVEVEITVKEIRASWQALR